MNAETGGGLTEFDRAMAAVWLAERMATAEHKPECPPPPFLGYSTSANPPYPGCVTDSDRALWARLADEAEAWLARNVEEALPI